MILYAAIAIMTISIILLTIFKPKERFTLGYKNIELLGELNEQIYPVGAIIVTTKSDNPKTLLSGMSDTEWELLRGNNMIRTCGSSYTISDDVELYNQDSEPTAFGPFETEETTLTVYDIPSHTHIIPEVSGNATHRHTAEVITSEKNGNPTPFITSKDCGTPSSKLTNTEDADAIHAHWITTEYDQVTGDANGHSHSITLPYRKFYVWKRTK